MQAAHHGADPAPGVRAAPAWRGCLPEPVHPRGHQWEEVRALATVSPQGELGESLPLTIPGLCIHLACWEVGVKGEPGLDS